MLLTIKNAEFRASERKNGTFTPDGESEARAYDFTELKFLHDDTDSIIKVRLPKGVHTHDYTRGEVYDLVVTVPDRTKVTLAAEQPATV